MPLFMTVGAPGGVEYEVRANQFLAGHPLPTGGRLLTKETALRIANGDKWAAIWLMMRLGVMTMTMTDADNPPINPLSPGDWVVVVKGARLTMSDEAFRRSFTPVETTKAKGRK